MLDVQPEVIRYVLTIICHYLIYHLSDNWDLGTKNQNVIHGKNLSVLQEMWTGNNWSKPSTIFHSVHRK